MGKPLTEDPAPNQANLGRHPLSTPGPVLERLRRLLSLRQRAAADLPIAGKSAEDIAAELERMGAEIDRLKAILRSTHPAYSRSGNDAVIAQTLSGAEADHE